jgi:iron(III) transport system permease protein
METLSDFGSVSFFGISTLTTGIYNAWITFDDLTLANRLSFYLLLFILGLFVLENLSRKKAQYHTPTKSGLKKKALIKLTRKKSILAFFFCLIVFSLSFLFPVLQMLYWTMSFPKHLADLDIIRLSLNTIFLVFLSSIILICLSFISNYGNRVTRSKLLDGLTTFSISGYAIPGIILAIAFITFVSWFDNNIISFFGFKTIKSIFIGSILGLVLVYFIRFYSLASNGIKSGYLKINYSIDESAYLLGYSKFRTFTNIHIPYLKNSILLISVLISIEIIKELPITLIMRPFNFETFATTAYIFASQDLLEAAAAPSLFLIIIASFFILITSRYILRD